jgi:hypothetical protein
MLGFAAFSETTLSQSSTSLQALAFLSSSLGQSTAGGLLFDAKALFTLPNVSAVGANTILFDAQASTAIVGLLSTTSINDVVSNGAANITQPPATATFTAGTLDYQGIAHITPTGAFVTGTAGDFGDVDAQANITTVGTSSTTAVTDFADVRGGANITPSSATAFLTIYIGDFADEDAQARAFMPPAVSVTSIASVDFDAQSNITTGSTSAIFSISTTDPKLEGEGQATATFSGTLANLYQNLVDPTAVIFPYQNFADDYNRNRTLFVSAHESRATVYVAEEDYTVYIQEQQGSNTVHIAA